MLRQSLPKASFVVPAGALAGSGAVICRGVSGIASLRRHVGPEGSAEGSKGVYRPWNAFLRCGINDIMR